jgi:hypothetical protein
MPYISPKGAIKSSIPPSKPKTKPASAQDNTPSDGKIYLVESEDTRPMDPKVVEELDHWKGWGARRESEAEDEDVDPLVESAKTERGTESKDLVLERTLKVEVMEVVEAI